MGKLLRKGEHFMLVFVINKHGKPLMPCKPSRARKLLKQGKAKIVKYEPFTIQLLYGSSGFQLPTTYRGGGLWRHNLGWIVSVRNDYVMTEYIVTLGYSTSPNHWG